MGMISLDDLDKCIEASNELIGRVEEWFTSGDLEDYKSLDFEGKSYNLLMIEEGDWDDEGKYQYQYNLYQLASYDKNVKCYLCNESLIDKYNLFLGQCVTRCGSYFSDYYYEFDKPDISIAYVEHIPEVIIPAHDEVKLKELNRE